MIFSKKSKGLLLNISLQGLKAQWAELLERLIQMRDIFRTAQDVYVDLVGIDMDDTSLFAIQLRNPLGTISIVSAGVTELTPGVIVDDAVVDKSTLSTDFGKMIANAKIRSKICALAVIGSKVVIKQFKLDKPLSDEDAEARAWQEARRAFPEIVKNMFLDFSQEIEVTPDHVKKYVLVVVIARKEEITSRLDAIQQAGLTTKIVDVDYYALERAYRLFASQLPAKHTEKFVALIHFNSHSMLFVVMHRKSAVYFTRQNYVGNALLPLVQRAMGFEHADLKNKPTTIAAPPPITLSLEMPIQMQTQMPGQIPVNKSDGLTDEQKSHAVLSIRRLFQSFYAEQVGHVIDCIALTGQCALLPELREYIEKMMDIPVIVANPLASLKVSGEVNAKIIKMGPAFAVCCGLAMRGIQT